MVRRPLPVACLVASALLPALDMAVSVTPVAAQSTLTSVTPLPQRRIEPPRRADPGRDAEIDPDLPPPPQLRRAVSDGDDLTAREEERAPRDGDDPGRLDPGAARDGEYDAGDTNEPPQDGVVVQGEPEPLRDGEPDVDRDPRLKADIDAFTTPPAGYDAVAFQIDSMDPVLDRRPSRLARFEPYDPIGIRRGTWVIFPEIEFGAGATTNVRRSAARDASGVFDVRPTVRLISNWRQHAAEFKATGLASAYPGFASENDRAYALEARGRLDFSRRSTIEVLVSHQRDQEKRSARNALDAALFRPDVKTNRAAVAINHRYNRLALQLRGSVTTTDYEGVETAAGFASNDERDVTAYGAGARATWELTPTLFAFTDVGHIDRRYRTVPSDGITRDSRGLRAVAGLSFGNSGKIWRGEISAGYGTQRPVDGRLAETGGLILDANLGWRMTALTSFLLSARTDFEDSTTPGRGGSRAQTFAIEARHAFRQNLIAVASLSNTATGYRGAALRERETTAEIGFDWYLNRTTTLTSRYTHVDFGSNAAGGDYTVDSVRFGVRVRQ